jgi:hypothetical protein
MRKRTVPLKWEFEIVLQGFFPFLDSVDQRRFSIVNKTMRDWSEEAAKIHLRRNHISDKELKRFFLFTSTCKKNLTRKLMFDKYKELRLRGRDVSTSPLQVNRASLSVLIFFLHNHNKRALEHLVHCSKSFFPDLRRAFLQIWLRVQMFSCRYPINRTALSTNVEQPRELTKNMSSLPIDKKRARPSGPQRTAKRVCQRPRRERRKVTRFEPEATKLIDDDDCEEEGEDCGDSAMEERSEDSDSEGSLKDFIVSDESSDDESKESYDSCAEEEELSSYETSSESQFSVYSDDED